MKEITREKNNHLYQEHDAILDHQAAMRDLVEEVTKTCCKGLTKNS